MKVTLLLCALLGTTYAFQPTGYQKATPSIVVSARRRTLVEDKTTVTFDPLNLSDESFSQKLTLEKKLSHRGEYSSLKTTGLAATGFMTALTAAADTAQAAADKAIFSQGQLDPSTFQPVCPASDGFYRFLQSSTAAVVGPDSFVEYGPLIAGGLLRVRLELCVVESFFQEAVVPFINRNGLSWILPLHETVETFLAGTIFALAATFILIGSTKLVSVIVFFTDLIFGGPARLFGGFFYDRARGKPVTLDLGLGPFKTRVIGPPDEDIENNKVDPLDRGTGEVVVIALSGAVKYAGEFLKVRYCPHGYCAVMHNHVHHPTAQPCCRCFKRLSAKLLTPLMSLWVDISSFGPVGTFCSSLPTTKSSPTFPRPAIATMWVHHMQQSTHPCQEQDEMKSCGSL